MIELRRFLIVWLVLIVVATFFMGVVPLFREGPQVDRPVARRICRLYERDCAGVGVWLVQEDDPAWDCKTMGNGVCSDE